ncbi:MAG: zinc ribbon domain-containing protein, partial [Acidobacteriota bacterium]|nr:zinc ribbon domain-containing protein [Acidobacteriota bacterium]
MFCPKCGKDNPGDNKFCRACGENLQAIASAMKPGWYGRWLPLLDRYIRYRNRTLEKAAQSFRQTRWLWLTLILIQGTLAVTGNTGHSLFLAALILLVLLVGAWDYIT